MPDLQIDRVFRLKNYPSVDVRVVVASTEGILTGTAHTGGRMQIRMQTPKAVKISAGVYAPFGAARPGLPEYVARTISEIAKSYGKAACLVSRFNVTCTIENSSISPNEALNMLDRIGKKFEQQVEHVEINMRHAYTAGAGLGPPVISEPVLRERRRIA